jgi:bla regulator protein BlaR1
MPSFDTLREVLASGFEPVAVAATYAGLLAVAVALINVFLRRWISPGQMALLWGLVLVRLILPAAPTSPLSVQYLLTAEKVEDPQLREIGTQPKPAAAAYSYQAQQEPPVEISSTSEADESESGVDPLFLLFTWLPFVWFTVGVTGLTWTTAHHWRFCRRVNQVPRCNDARLLRLLDECCIAAGVNRNCSIVLCDYVDHPAIMGLSHKTLLLPNDSIELTDAELRMIMLHEVAHVRRRDIAANWALVAIRTIHWWNPIYWLAASRFRSLQEQACDAFVVRCTENGQSQQYSELLLTLAGRPTSRRRWSVMLPASILSFFPSVFRNRAVRVRLKSLRTAGIQRGRWHTAIVASLILLVAIAGLTDARTPEPTPPWIQSYGQPFSGSIDLSKYEVEEEVYDGPIVTRSYEITNVLDRITADAATTNADAAKSTLLETLHQFFPSADHLATAASSHIKRGTAHDTSPKLMFTIHDKTLVAAAPEGMHKKIARTLNAWGKNGLTQFTVETRFLTAQGDLASQVGITWEYVEAVSSAHARAAPFQHPNGTPVVYAQLSNEAYLPIAVATLDAKQANALLNAAQADRRANVLSAPKITLFNGEEANIADCAERPFVVGVRENKSGVTKPKIAILPEGSKIRLRCTENADRKHVHLDAGFDFSSIQEVMTMDITNIYRKAASIQIPHVNRRVFDIDSNIEFGRSLLIAAIPADEKPDYFYVLLTTAKMPEPREQKETITKP